MDRIPKNFSENSKNPQYTTLTGLLRFQKKKKKRTFLLVSVFGSHALDKLIADRLTTI